MKKFGFTLAEVLITLGIIGVVAALTAPALTKNTGQAKIGPALAKFVNTFEVAAESLMNDENADKLSSIATTDAGLGNAFAKYIVMAPYSDTVQYVAPNGSGSAQTMSGAKYQLKDGSIVAISYYYPQVLDYSSYKGVCGRIIYDINGNKAGKNRAGKDVFAFYIDNSGVLIPQGSNAEKYVRGSKGTCSPSSSSYTDGLNCTGAIADNGWKAEY